MTHRCYSAAPIASSQFALDGAEAHHLLHVLRVGPGARMTLFDGSGCEFDAEVTSCGRSTVELAVLARREIDRELPQPLTLGVPLPKGDRQRWIVEKAVELGVTTLVPLRTERTVATGERAGEKLDRYVIEASKQCGRNRLMAITVPQDWAEWLTAPTDPRRLIADPTGESHVATDSAGKRPAFAAVGPEGGLTDKEIVAARDSGWEIVSLGPRILRIETAAVALVTRLTLP